jgi:hypothetical protein
MLILRKCSRSNKIKNRYIITMVYKTKRINRRRYIKRQSRKRMYGGETNPVESQYNQPPPPPPTPKEEVKLPPPTMMDNLEDIGNVAAAGVANVVADSVNSAAEYLNVNPDDSATKIVEETGEKVKEIAEALDSPEGQKLKENIGELGEDLVDTLQPAADKVVDIVKKEAPKLVETGSKIVITALNELPPVFAFNEASNLVAAAAETGEAVAELTTTGAEAAKSLQENEKKAETVWEQTKNFFNKISTGVNQGVSGVVKSAQQNVDKYGQNVMKERIEDMKKVSEMPKVSVQQGGSLKKYQREGMMIGGRVNKSQLEFLTPYVNRSQILQQYGGKWNTKRRNRVRRRLTSRRR